MNKAEAYFQLAAPLAGGSIGILAVGAVSAALGNETLAMLLVYGGGLLMLPAFALVVIGLIAQR